MAHLKNREQNILAQKIKTDEQKSLQKVVVSLLVEWLLPTPEVCSSNPVIGKIDSTLKVLSAVLKRHK